MSDENAKANENISIEAQTLLSLLGSATVLGVSVGMVAVSVVGYFDPVGACASAAIMAVVGIPLGVVLFAKSLQGIVE